jgi:hypothetical protein
MRLHSITLTDFKGVAGRRVDFAAEGLTLVVGRNEIGKTSLVDALDLLIDEKSTSKKQAIKEAQPTNRDVGPEVEAELSVGPYRLRYRKRWLKSPLCELHISEPKPEQFTGEQAHERFGAILDEQAVDRLLWKQLRIDQSGLVVQAKVDDRPAIARALGVQAAAGTDAEPEQSTGGGPEAQLYDLAAQELRRYLTKERREPTGELKAAKDALAEATAAHGAAQQALADAQSAIDEYEQTGRLLAENSEALGTARDELADLEDQDAELAQELDRRRALELRITVLERKDSATRKVAQLEANLDDLGRDVAAARDVAAVAEQARQEGDARAATLRLELNSAREAARQATAHLRYHADRSQEAALAARLDRAREAAERASRVTAELSRITITEELLDQIEAAHNAWERARATLDSNAPTITLTRLGAAEILLDGELLVSTPGAADTQLSITEPVIVEAPGLLRVVVSPGVDEHNRRDRFDEAAAGYGELCAQAAVADLVEARGADRARRGLIDEQRDAERGLEAALAGETHASLTHQVAVLRDRIAAYAAGGTVDTAGDADIDANAAADVKTADAKTADAKTTVEQLESIESAARSAADQSEADARAAEHALRDLVDAVGKARERLALLDGRLESGQEELGRASAELAELPDLVDGEQLGELKALLAAAISRIADHQPDLLALKLKNTRELIQQSGDAQVKLRERRARATERMAVSGESGPVELLARAAATLERAEYEFERLRQRADAACLLFDTLDGHRLAARRSYAAPLRERIEHYASMVFSPSVRVEISDELTVSSKTVGGVTVPFGQLSAGAQEQVALLGRIACAELIAPAMPTPDERADPGSPTGRVPGGVPLIIDDALGHSDRERLAALAAILALAAEQLQIIVLTSAPERFRIGAALRVDL